MWSILRDITRILGESALNLQGGTPEVTLEQKLLDFWQNVVNNLQHLHELSFWLIFSVSVFMGLTVGPILVVYLQLDSVALSASPTCVYGSPTAHRET